MVKKIRLLLEYNTYPIWLYDENNEIIDNDNPPEWNNDQQLTSTFMEASNLYDTFFIDNEKEFSFIGCPDAATADRLKDLIAKATRYLEEKNAGKYTIQNDIDLDIALHFPNS